VKAAIVDVGSNTVRLLVAVCDGANVEPVREEREHLLLGRAVERDGRLPAARIEDAAQCTAAYARLARGLGAREVEVIVTAPGRQAGNGADLLRALADASGARVRLLSADEEGRLAFAGAVAAAESFAESIAVCDTGGGSTEVVVGTVRGGPVWTRSYEVGAVRLTERFLTEDPPGKRALALAREEVQRQLSGFAPPLPQAALAAGGTARALRKVAGRTLGPAELAEALRELCRRPSAKTAKAFGLHEHRARTLPAGTVVLAAVQQRLGVPLEVSRAGLREGALLALVAELSASAA
jgi:exopolyphosphatase / guanosine-5'-triphosphate,3'-diphosphate pyrophosphatase